VQTPQLSHIGIPGKLSSNLISTLITSWTFCHKSKVHTAKKYYSTIVASSMPLGNVDEPSDDLSDEGTFYPKITIAYMQ